MLFYLCHHQAYTKSKHLCFEGRVKPTHSSGYELHLGFIAMGWAQPFSRHHNKTPYNHLQEFEEGVHA